MKKNKTDYAMYLNSMKKLLSYCNKESYSGYSLYDSHNSPIPFKLLGKKLSFIINQVNKRSPLNVRSILGIKKAYNPKGMGLFLYSYSKLILSKINIGEDIHKKADYFFNWLKDNYNPNYSGNGWGYHYDWPKSDGTYVPKNTPNTVVTAFNTRALFEYYKINPSKEVADLIIGAKDFILNNTYKIENSDGVCYSYTPLGEDITINASLLAGEVFAYCDYVQNKHDFEDEIGRILKFTMNHQNADGSWFYSFNAITNKPKKQIDFHQGYVLDSIYNLCKYSKHDIEKYRENIQKGLDYYYMNQFNKDGSSYWRYPAKWPVDIHNQSQGIITFSRFSEYNDEYLPFAQKIAEWTIKNMQNSRGNYYYQKWPMIMNKVSYMRWNNAWMLVAFSELLNKLKDD